MRYSYRVVVHDDLARLAGAFQFPSSQRREYATLVQEAFNRMDADGWHFVDSFSGYGGLLFVFRRESFDELPETGIKAGDPQ
jgi:hypothetical protein